METRDLGAALAKLPGGAPEVATFTRFEPDPVRLRRVANEVERYGRGDARSGSRRTSPPATSAR